MLRSSSNCMSRCEIELTRTDKYSKRPADLDLYLTPDLLPSLLTNGKTRDCDKMRPDDYHSRSLTELVEHSL